MTHDDELIERVATDLYGIEQPGESWAAMVAIFGDCTAVKIFRAQAVAAITAVRAYDAERRSSVLDVDAIMTTRDADIVHVGTTDESPTTWVVSVKATPGFRATDEQLREMTKPSIPTHDPDDYRDLPLAMRTDVRFEGGLTEKKRD